MVPINTIGIVRVERVKLRPNCNPVQTFLLVEFSLPIIRDFRLARETERERDIDRFAPHCSPTTTANKHRSLAQIKRLAAPKRARRPRLAVERRQRVERTCSEAQLLRLVRTLTHVCIHSSLRASIPLE